MPAIGQSIKRVVTVNETLFPYLVVLGELAVGIGLVFGFLTPLAVIVALFLNLNYLVTAGVKPNDITVNNCFRVEQGQNWSMILIEVVILATGAWQVWSIDNLLNIIA